MRNSGKEYKTLAKGTLVKKREILAPCNEKCRLKCTRKFTDENRSQIFTTFWNLEDLQKQRCFVLNSMRPIMPKYKKVRPEGGRERSCNKAYYFTINSVLTQVCQRFFTSTLGISDRFIRTVVSKDKDGFLEDELRGKKKRVMFQKKLNKVLGSTYPPYRQLKAITLGPIPKKNTSMVAKL